MFVVDKMLIYPFFFYVWPPKSENEWFLKSGGSRGRSPSPPRRGLVKGGGGPAPFVFVVKAVSIA